MWFSPVLAGGDDDGGGTVQEWHVKGGRWWGKGESMRVWTGGEGGG